ncbi:MAG TPA: sigma-54 dependent transcriptional regulator, partial [Polyangiaceae bacterium]|nr:sigma-54 dependent transcriptional regulator [Polyangiaceae bacterium]
MIEPTTIEILLVDDDEEILRVLSEALRGAGYAVTTAPSSASAQLALGERCFDIAVCDQVLPDGNGLYLLQRIRRAMPGCDVIVMSAHATVPDAVFAMQERATHVLKKPFGIQELLDRVATLIETRQQRHLLEPTALLGRSPEMARVRHRLAAIAGSDSAVLVTGETGTGKELVAKCIHALSARAQMPLVAVNCAALPDTLLEAELFGHERGAFTGAWTRRHGRFHDANGGTLFLDELAEMSPAAQAKLLRVLDHGTYEPLGSNITANVDVRLVSATNADVHASVRSGALREDLFHRINVFHLHLPALRERRSDLPLLAHHLLARLTGGGVPTITKAAWERLEHYDFPGNVRELKHALEHALVLAKGGEIDVRHLPPEIRERPSSAMRPAPLVKATQDFERAFLIGALEQCGGRKLECAR